MRGKTVNVEDAKTPLSRLIARVERGERIIIARAGKPVAELRPVRRMKKRSVPLDDPLLRVDEYSYDGPIGSTANRDIDATVCEV
jgi:prevent-host-death family protein